MNHVTSGDILQIILALHGAATLIVNLTPTPRDNEVVFRFYRCIELFAGLWTPLAKR